MANQNKYALVISKSSENKLLIKLINNLEAKESVLYEMVSEKFISTSDVLRKYKKASQFS